MGISNAVWNLQTKQAFNKWLETQNFSNWRVVTFKYPYMGDRYVWTKACKNTFIELDNTFLKGALLTKNKENGAGKHLRRLVALGGNIKAGERIHAHCLVDGIGDDNKFNFLITRAWRHNIRKAVKHSSGNYVFEENAQVFVKKTDGICKYYTNYIMRSEGYDFNFGVDKVVFEATYLASHT